MRPSRRAALPAVLLAAATAGCAPGAAPAWQARPGTPVAVPSPGPAAATGSPAPAAPTSSPASPGRVVVVLDPGHDGGNAAHPAAIGKQVPDGAGGTKDCNTTGTATAAGYPEHAFTWDVALRTEALLEQAGITVVLTRDGDTGVGPCVDQRARVAGQVGAAAFVGIHGDGAAPGGRGFHVITSALSPAGAAVRARTRALAADVRDAMTAVEPVSTYLGRDGLDERRDLAGLNLNPVPAVYVECGNMRNATDAAAMSSAAGRQAIAGRLAAGIRVFLGR